ncbi:hypothetical protein [Mammaliicoccus vitulinus]|uniref:hypothetical protein n=1 Tax=Mammaliicoccus vitulinus TaxID=71237 RepID=UPI000D1D3DF5|nr:hypothetical protein [Mammaliicoccus vitulinus]PTI89843.1 hypothetical protein BU071_05060 [Mammaliicoccus vitulinus]QQT15120.1 hypothetical protein I6J10_11225 [Mammaliicoccus vitulinus]QQY19580.1 hypothetical protein I6J11_00500 [Mammaliicoccus vitulinus]RTX86375.1 hypothetical protein CD108_08170 [Mammaliicoccus vitulinus]GGI03864.1 hypothetical protein GCM10007366_22900 [Mammaliicoccus vitulinus]
MLTKEFAAKVGLSEKQVRKIVQHLEDRGYQLSKTEYRGREATDFQEEDVELFQEIAEKVKETNSYDQAFETLEKEKDFLQVLVKDQPDQQSPELQQLIEELRTEVQHMRRERQMLGEMLQQVHIQQQKLEQTLALQAPQQTEEAAQTNSSESVTADITSKEAAENKEDTNISKETVSTEEKIENKLKDEDKVEDKASAVKTEPTTDKTEEVKVETKEADPTQEVAADKQEEAVTTEKQETTNNIAEEEKVDTPSTLDATSEETKLETEEPKKKGFFSRLFNI